MSTKLNQSDVKPLILDSTLFGFVLCIVFVKLFPMNEEQLIDLNRNLTIGGICLALGTGLSFTLNKMGIQTLGRQVFHKSHGGEQVVPWYKTFWGYELLFGFLLALVVGLELTKFSLYEILSESGFEGAKRIFSAILSPNFEVLPRAFLAIIETIFIAFISTVLAVPIAFVMGFLCSKNIMGKNAIGFSIYALLRTFLNIIRSCEPLVWAIVFSVWVGIGPFAGMLALLLHSVASLGKLYSEQIECVLEGPIEGIQSTGAGALQTIWFAVVPQFTLPFVAHTISRWDINVRMATIIGLVGGGGIGTMLIQYQGQALWNEVGALVLLIALVVWIMDTASAYIREAIK